MLNENVITTQTKLTQDVQIELTADVKKTGLKFTVGGGAATAVTAAVAIVGYVFEWSLLSTLFFVLLVCAAIIFVCGIILLRSYKKTMQAPLPDTTFGFAFYDEGMTAVETRDGQVVSVSKTGYCNLKKTKETPRYLFLYINDTAAFVIEKADLTQAEYGTVRAKCGLPVIGETIPLAPFRVSLSLPEPDAPREQKEE